MKTVVKISVLFLVAALSSISVACSSTKKTDDNTLKLWIVTSRFFLKDRLDTIPYEKGIGYIEKKTGTKLQFTEVLNAGGSGGNDREAFNILIATNKLPDILYLPGANVGFFVSPDQLFANKQSIDLQPYAKDMPNYMKLLESSPVLQKNVKDDSGHILYFAYPQGAQEMSFSGGIMVRQDWLDKLGIKTPVTIDDFFAMFRAIRDGDPNGNGKKDEIPLVGNEGSLQVFGNLAGVQEGFSMLGGPAGKVIFGPFEEDLYKTRLRIMRTMVKEKFINENYFGFKFNMRDTMVAQNIVGSAYTGISNMDKWNRLMIKDNPKFLLWPLVAPVMPDGKRYFDRDGLTNVSASYGNVVTTAAKNPALATKFVDFFYSDEGRMFQNFGTEGITYTMDGSFPRYTDLILKNPQGLASSDAINKYIGITSLPNYAPLVANDINQVAQQAFTSPAGRQAIKIWTDSFTIETNTTLPNAVLEAKDQIEYGQIMGDVNTYLQESIAGFMSGKLDIDKDYPTFVKRLHEMKADRALALQQKAVVAWQNRGGIAYKFTMPRAKIDWKKIPLITDRGIERMDPSLK